MKIAYTMAPGRGDTDRVLFRLSEELAAKGLRCCGTVQVNTDRATGPCDMDIKILPAGPTFRISQHLGAAARGCRLNPSALEGAVGLAEVELSRGTDLVIINKFGKHEAEGRGFRNVIAEAIMRDIPVLVGVNSLNQKAFMDFAGTEVKRVAPSVEILLDWLQSDLHFPRQVA